ncbi:MAG: histidine kinase, partial [Eubacteriales bacterium]
MKLKYISVRVFWTWLLFLLIFVARLIFDIYQLIMGRISLPNLLVTMGLVILFSLGTYFGIYKPYQQSEKMMERFLDGLELPDFADGNMLVLTPGTHKAIHRIDQVLHAPEIFELNKRQAQYLALQNQINPHFLYNTLESIRSEAIIAGLHSVSDMTESLATFFRYTISKVENLVSIEEELENCKTYFHIQ